MNRAPHAPAFIQTLDTMHDAEETLVLIPEPREPILVLQGIGKDSESYMARENAVQ